MDYSLIFGGQATLEDLHELNEKRGFVFVIEDGKVTEVISNGSGKVFREQNKILPKE